jgi:hypothetical protein
MGPRLLPTLRCLLVLVAAARAAAELHFQPPLVIHSKFDPQSYWLIAENFQGRGGRDGGSGSTATHQLPSLITGSLNGPILWHVRTAAAGGGRGSGGARDGARWETFEIANLKGAVHAAPVDVNGDGLLDLIVAYAFGPGCPSDCSKDDGRLAYLENPGGEFGVAWRVVDIGKSRHPAHRVAVFNKEDRAHARIVGVPVAGVADKSLDDPMYSPSEIFALSLPPQGAVHDPDAWRATERVVASDLTICHDGRPWSGVLGGGGSDGAAAGARPRGAALLLACSQGLISYDLTTSDDGQHDEWRRIGQQAFTLDPDAKYKGLSSAVQIGESSFAFIGPYHGNTFGISTADGPPGWVDQPQSVNLTRA